MIRSTIAFVAAAMIAVAGYAALGAAAHTTPRPELKVIAVVVAHPRHHAAVSAVRTRGSETVVQ